MPETIVLVRNHRNGLFWIIVALEIWLCTFRIFTPATFWWLGPLLSMIYTPLDRALGCQTQSPIEFSAGLARMPLILILHLKA